MKSFNELKRISLFTLSSLLLLNGCSGKSNTVGTTDTNKGTNSKWELIIDKSKISGNVNIAQFVNEKKGITVGYDGEIHYTEDGGKTWPKATNKSACRYGVSAIDENTAVSCGNNGEIRISNDSGKTWSPAGTFSSKNYYCSFTDSKNGWVASSCNLAVTTDGGKTYNEIPLSKGINSISTIFLNKLGTGYLLNNEGKLFSTKDSGKSWSELGILPSDGKLNILSGTMQQAAINFSDEKHGLIFIVTKDGSHNLLRSEDGGINWKKEVLPESTSPYAVTISPDSNYLTFTWGSGAVSVLKYKS